MIFNRITCKACNAGAANRRPQDLDCIFCGGDGYTLQAPADHDWIQTFTGLHAHPLAIAADEICLSDIAHALANVCRFGGHTRRFYSVAEHCGIVAGYVPKIDRREALLHDAAEAYIGDMVAPLKHSGRMETYREIERAIEVKIFQRFGIVSTPESRKSIKAVETRLLVDEERAFMQRRSVDESVSPLNVCVPGLQPFEAEISYLHDFATVFGVDISTELACAHFAFRGAL